MIKRIGLILLALALAAAAAACGNGPGPAGNPSHTEIPGYTENSGDAENPGDAENSGHAKNPGYAENPGCAERPVGVISQGEKAGEIRLRFYDETPNVPYMGMIEYARFLGRPAFSLREGPDGTWELENFNGAKLVCDPKEGRLSAQDWNAFLALPMPLEDRALGFKDASVHYARITEIAYEGEPTPVTVDLAKYGIRLYCDESDVYLPVSTLTNLMADFAGNFMVYNGENLYALTYLTKEGMIGEIYGSEALQAQLRGEDRPEDIIKQCYADLCLNFDYFFGHPGRAVLDGAVAEQGLDQALESLGEDGRAIKEGLFSPSLTEYINALQKLFFRYLEDKHTLFTAGAALASEPSANVGEAFAETVLSAYTEEVENSPSMTTVLKEIAIPVQRALRWGEDSYRAYGSTAIIRLDSFDTDAEAWDSYYNDAGEFPQDALGTVATGLKRASEDPEIENVIFDLSCNQGGSPDVMMAILALNTGQDRLRGRNVLTGQPMTVTFEIDANFDGVFDEKDKEARYGFNYGVLVTNCAFSCGNLFPIVLREAGAVLIGEPSGGGSCSVQLGSDAQCLWYTMSSCQWQLTNSEGVSVEGGCSIDVPIEPAEIPLSVLPEDPEIQLIANWLGENVIVNDYRDFYDDARLDSIMKERFGTQALPDQAA